MGVENQSHRSWLRHLDWPALTLSIAGILLNANRNLWCWPIWIGSNLCWIGYALKTKQKPLFLLQLVFIGMDRLK